MTRVTELIGSKKLLFTAKDKLIYPLGKRSRVVRKIYWKVSKRYLWGIVNWLLDFEIDRSNFEQTNDSSEPS